MTSVEKGATQVSHVAKDLPKLPGTTVKSSFIKRRQDSWQNHLQRISPFLTAGEGVWWTSVDGGFHFRDGDGDSNTQSEDCFTLLHFRQHSIMDVEERRKRSWRKREVLLFLLVRSKHMLKMEQAQEGYVIVMEL